ncbi:hypothetical protein BH20ACT2_BH20ACT2_09880 [soil metagenome]
MTGPSASSAPAAPTEAVERQIASDMVRRGLPAAPVIVIAAWLLAGGDGAWSALTAVGLVLANLVLSALSLGWAARVSLTAIMAVALGGFLVRMALVCGVIVLIQDLAWVDLTTLAVTVLVTHLGLLFWETRYVSASLAFPALKPKEAYPS